MGRGIYIAAVVTAAVAIGVVMWQSWPLPIDEAIVGKNPVAATGKLPAGTVEQARVANWPPPFPEQTEDRKYVPLLPTGPQLSAAQSLSATRDGDPRTPPIVHEQNMQAMPSAAELADPKAYQQYEARQNTRVYAAYVQAADQEIPRLREAIARARDMGMAAADLSKGEEKLRRITAMQEQLLNSHPELKNAGGNAIQK